MAAVNWKTDKNGDLIATGPNISGTRIKSDKAVVHCNLSASSTTPTLANNTILTIDYDNVLIDNTGSVTTGTGWVFTAPRAGYYRYSASVGWNNTTDFTQTSGEVATINAFLDGVKWHEEFYIPAGVGQLSQPRVTINGIVQMGAGQELSFVSLQNSGATITYKSINRISCSINEL